MDTLTATLPPDIPAPKFNLFQPVSVALANGEPRTGVVVGLHYVTLFAAIANERGNYGWFYEVDFYFGASFETMLDGIPDGSSETFREPKLTAVEVA
jgi:hypothetical protein